MAAVFVMMLLWSTAISLPVAQASNNTRVVINIPSKTLRLFVNSQLVKQFPVGVGRPQFKTPVGHFKVITKTINPSWENPYLGAGKMRIGAGATNPLGTRWIGFYEDAGGEYGMHGTDRPESVGKLSSHGCVRMKIKDAETLFDLVDYNTPVDVTYDTIVASPVADNTVVLNIYPDVYNYGASSIEKAQQHIREQFPEANVQIKFVVDQPSPAAKPASKKPAAKKR